MSKHRKSPLFISLVASALVLVLFVSCSMEVPNAPKADPEVTFDGAHFFTKYRSDESIAARTETQRSSIELKFVELPTIKGKKNETYVEGKITVKTGGHLAIDYRQPLDVCGHHFKGTQRIKINLKARPHSVSHDSVWSMSLGTEYLMLVLEPEGLEFLKPVELSIETQNIDLSALDPATIGLYYYNEDENNWELMEPTKLDVNIDKGRIKGHWHIYHFSRYAVASR